MLKKCWSLSWDLVSFFSLTKDTLLEHNGNSLTLIMADLETNPCHGFWFYFAGTTLYPCLGFIFNQLCQMIQELLRLYLLNVEMDRVLSGYNTYQLQKEHSADLHSTFQLTWPNDHAQNCTMDTFVHGGP